MKHLFIINPAAGKGKALSYISQIEDYFSSHEDEYIISVTKSQGHAVEIAREYAGKGIDRIYSVGGDGTLNEVLNGMAGAPSVLGIIPSGSGNDLVKSIYSEESLHNILGRTIEGEEKYIDVGKVNDRFFLNIASMGFDAEVVYNSRRLKKLPGISGSMAYILGIFATVLTYKGNTLKMDIDGNLMEVKTLLAAIANGRYYGGGMLPAPGAVIDDGEFEVCIIKDIGLLKILSFFPKLIKGTHGSIKEVSFHKCSKIEIDCSKSVVMNIDGEIQKNSKAAFEILPKGIKVLIPKRTSEYIFEKNRQSEQSETESPAAAILKA